MDHSLTNPVLDAVRRSLGRQPGAPVAPRPAILPPRVPGDPEAELDLLLAELAKISAKARRLPAGELEAALRDLVAAERVQRAVLWETADLAALRLADHLRALGVTLIPAHADKQTLATCDLGVTGVDFAVPDTGTIGLLSSAEQPRAVSLLPRVHLALLRPAALRADLHQVFAQAKAHNYLIFITGPSRTADIELTVTLGVHGPQELYVWALSGDGGQ